MLLFADLIVGSQRERRASMIQTIRKAVEVLGLFSIERPEWGVSEAARVLDVPKSSASHLMSTLAEQGMLRRTSKSRYRLGWRLFEFSQTLLDTTEFHTESRRVMEDLVACWKETVHLAVLDGADAVYVEKMQPTPAVKILVSRVGARLPAHSVGVGKALLAHRPWDEISGPLLEAGLPALTPDTITSLGTLAEELGAVRERGYAYDKEESMIGLCCVAAPIRDAGGEVIAALSMSAPAYRFYSARDKYTRAVLEATRRISTNYASTHTMPQSYDYRRELQKA